MTQLLVAQCIPQCPKLAKVNSTGVPFLSKFSFFLWVRVSSIKLAIVAVTGGGLQGPILKSVWD